jgi:hypothetical protein
MQNLLGKSYEKVLLTTSINFRGAYQAIDKICSPITKACSSIKLDSTLLKKSKAPAMQLVKSQSKARIETLRRTFGDI